MCPCVCLRTHGQCVAMEASLLSPYIFLGGRVSPGTYGSHFILGLECGKPQRCSCLGCLRAGITGIHLMLGLLYGIQTPVLMIVQQALFPNDPCLSLSLLLLFLRQVSCNPGWLQTYCEAKDDFELLILVPSPPECWDMLHHHHFIQC